MPPPAAGPSGPAGRSSRTAHSCRASSTMAMTVSPSQPPLRMRRNVEHGVVRAAHGRPARRRSLDEPQRVRDLEEVGGAHEPPITDAGGRTRRGGPDVARAERQRPTAAGSRVRPDGRHPQGPVTPRAARRRRDHRRRPGSIGRCPRGPGSCRGSARAYARRSQAPAGVRDLSDGGVVRRAGAHSVTCRLLGSFAVPEKGSCGDLPGLRRHRRSLVAAHGNCDSLLRGN